jgi:hypothetical protein
MAEVTRVAALMGWGGFEKQQGPKLHYLPLENGQYTLRDGRVATAEVKDGFATLSVGNTKVGVVFAESGRGSGTVESPYDVVGVVDPNGLFPLKEGQKVRARGGRELTVAELEVHASSGRMRAALRDERGTLIVRVYTDNGMRYSSGEQNPLDIVALVEPEDPNKLEFPLKPDLRVRLRNGDIAWTVPGYSSDVIGVAHEKGGSYFTNRFINDGRGNHLPAPDHPQDIVALAPEEETQSTDQLILPVQVGQRVRLRSGDERTVVRVEEGDNGLVSYRSDEGTVQNNMVYAKSGSGYTQPESAATAESRFQHRNDIVATISHPFPLQTGDTVRLRSGRTDTIGRTEGTGRSQVHWSTEGGRAWWTRNGKTGADNVEGQDDVMFIETRRVEEPVAA